MTEVVAYIRRIIANGGIADMVMICVPEYSPEFSLSPAVVHRPCHWCGKCRN
jgi:hypothetical protein